MQIVLGPGMGVFTLFALFTESSKRLKQLLSFAIGGLLGDVFVHLLPEAWAYTCSATTGTVFKCFIFLPGVGLLKCSSGRVGHNGHRKRGETDMRHFSDGLSLHRPPKSEIYF